MFKKKTLLILLLCLFSYTSLAYANDQITTAEEVTQSMEYAKGIVTEIVYEDFNQQIGAGLTQDEQLVKIKITDGPFAGQEFSTLNYTTGNAAYDTWVDVGDRVLLSLEVSGNDFQNGYILDYQKDNYLFLLIALFILSLLIIGKIPGLRAVITLTLTLLMIAFFLLPMLLRGYDPLGLAILTSIIITTLTLVIISGLSKKTLSAILGTTGGLIGAAIIAIIIGKLCQLRGLDSQEAQMLMFTTEHINFDFQSLLFAGIIIGSLGAVMDVTMSIASSIEEINRVGNNKLSAKELFRSGMNVGQDIMGTMSNTLILAYTGTSIPMLLLFMSNNEPFLKLINLDFIATEIVRSVSGSIGLLLAIPITAAISAWLLKGKKE